MWEAIASNQRRSLWLVGLMGVVLALLGAVIGLAVAVSMGAGLSDLGRDGPPRWGVLESRPLVEQVLDAQWGAYFGIAAAVLVWLILWATAAGAGDGILLNTAQAREIQKEDSPRLWNVVEEMTIAAGLGKMPRVFIIDDSGLNAFAVGYRRNKTAVAVTAGLLKHLTRDELQGVIAHEIGHIRNQDVRFMTLAAVMVGAIVLLSHGFLRGLYYSGRRRSSSRGGGGAQLVVLAVAVTVAILAPLAARLLYFACSRRREFLADASSARFTRYPPGLASALEKISRRAGGTLEVSPVVAPLYIVNPLQARAAFTLFSTHPRTEERIRILRGMGGAGFAAYEEAYRNVLGAHNTCIGPTTLGDAEAVELRDPTPEADDTADAVARAKEVGRILDHVVSLVVIPCVCGVRLKLPPGFQTEQLTCPRCGRGHVVPKAESSKPVAEGSRPEPLRYRRKTAEWESFQCSCGHPVQLSPKFSAPAIRCPKCHRRIEVAAPTSGGET